MSNFAFFRRRKKGRWEALEGPRSAETRSLTSAKLPKLAPRNGHPGHNGKAAQRRTSPDHTTAALTANGLYVGSHKREGELRPGKGEGAPTEEEGGGAALFFFGSRGQAPGPPAKCWVGTGK